MLGFTSLIYLCLPVSPSRPSGAWKVLTQQDGRVEFASRDDVALRSCDSLCGCLYLRPTS